MWFVSYVVLLLVASGLPPAWCETPASIPRPWVDDSAMGVLACQLPISVAEANRKSVVKILMFLHYSAWGSSFSIKASVTAVQDASPSSTSSSAAHVEDPLQILDVPLMLLPVLNDEELQVGHAYQDVHRIATANGRTLISQPGSNSTSGGKQPSSGAPHPGWLLNYYTRNGTRDGIGISWVSGLLQSGALPPAWLTNPTPAVAHTFRLVALVQEVCGGAKDCVPVEVAPDPVTGRLAGGCVLDARRAAETSALLGAVRPVGEQAEPARAAQPTPPGTVWLPPLPRTPQVVPSELVMVIKPLFGLKVDEIAALVHHHMVYHTALGAGRYVVYERLSTMLDALGAHPLLQPWLVSGRLLLVHWSIIPEDPVFKYQDQRVIHNHAMLAHTGREVLLAVLDLDEYIMPWLPERQHSSSSRRPRATATSLEGTLDLAARVRAQARIYPPRDGQAYPRSITLRRQGPGFESQPLEEQGLTQPLINTTGLTIQALISLCAPGSVSSLRVQRFNVLVTPKSDASAYERPLWVNVSGSGSRQHPLTHYTWVKHHPLSAPKSIVNPNHIRMFHIHTASNLYGFNTSYIHPRCLHMVHVSDMLSMRTSSSDRTRKFNRMNYIRDVLAALGMD